MDAMASSLFRSATMTCNVWLVSDFTRSMLRLCVEMCSLLKIYVFNAKNKQANENIIMNGN